MHRLGVSAMSWYFSKKKKKMKYFRRAALHPVPYAGGFQRGVLDPPLLGVSPIFGIPSLQSMQSGTVLQ